MVRPNSTANCAEGVWATARSSACRSLGCSLGLRIRFKKNRRPREVGTLPELVRGWLSSLMRSSVAISFRRVSEETFFNFMHLAIANEIMGWAYVDVELNGEFENLGGSVRKVHALAL